MRCHQILKAALLAYIFFAVSQTAGAATVATYSVSVNTTPLIGHPAGPFTILLALTDGSELFDGNTTVMVTNVNLAGGAVLDNPGRTGGVSGDLASALTLKDTSPLSTFSETFSPGQSLSFILSLSSTDDDSPTPDRFVFYILDNAGNPLPTTSPGADFLVGIDLGPSGGPPEVFGTDPSRPSVAGNPIMMDAPAVSLDKTPPVITASANPATLWPPNGKMVPVTISGTVADSLSGVNASTATFAVKDAYGLVQPSGPVSLASNGSYSFTIPLEAKRAGQDKNGRLYTIMVSAQDNAGNAASTTTTVIVPHDQGK
jgi:hypothetical protein